MLLLVLLELVYYLVDDVLAAIDDLGLVVLADPDIDVAQLITASNKPISTSDCSSC